jgi:hypothetical protein
MKGGDRVDADGIPLYTITHWQKAHFLDQVCSARPRITLPRIGFLFGEYQPNGWFPEAGPQNAAF